MDPFDYPDWETFMATSFAGRNSFPLVAPETPSFMSQPVAETPADLEGADVAIIGAPLCRGAGRTLCRRAHGGVDRGAQEGAPAVGALSGRLYPGLRSRTVRSHPDGRLRRCGDTSRGHAQPGPRADPRGAGGPSRPSAATPSGRAPCRWSSARTAPAAVSRSRRALRGERVGPGGAASAWTRTGTRSRSTTSREIPGSPGPRRGSTRCTSSWTTCIPGTWSRSASGGMLENREIVRRYLREGARFISSWELRTSLGDRGLRQGNSTAPGTAPRASTHISTWTSSAAPDRRRATSWANSSNRSRSPTTRRSASPTRSGAGAA